MSSIADKVGLSPMTVTRYLRELGYGSLQELKVELRHGPISSAWDISDSRITSYNVCYTKLLR